MESKLTPETEKKILEAIRKGAFVTDACALAGISRRTFYTWKQKGAMGDPQYTEFLDRIDKAEAELKETVLEHAKRCIDDRRSWEGDYRFLESRFPKDFMRSERVIFAADEAAAALTMKELFEALARPKSIPEIVEGEVKELPEGTSLESLSAPQDSDEQQG